MEMNRKYIKRDIYKGKSIAVLTSGGDSPGMNAALRGIVRMSNYVGCQVYFVNEGYTGLVQGGKNIVLAHWSSVSSIIHKGGTIIGSSRSDEFRQVSGRLKAAKNLIKLGIHHLIVIGGDGSLSGANEFQVEWDMLRDELLKKGEITADEAGKGDKIQIAGIVGSIDNDFYGTDLTLGTDSALHRIQWAVDSIVSTALSHQRIFILEVMGRHCGYLALVSALTCEADYMFIPEMPPPENWIEELVYKLQQVRNAGQRLNIIIVAEGANDRNGNPITSEEVRKVIKEHVKADARVTVLGHVQRGGHPSAIDRILGSRMGVEAALSVIEQNSCVVAIDGNQIVRRDLMECVEKTRAVAKALSEKQWDRAMHLRGNTFERNFKTYQALALPDRPFLSLDAPVNIFKHNLAIVNIGMPASGMNALVHSFVRTCLINNICPYAVYGSIEGFSRGNLRQMKWWDVHRWVSEGGSILGSKVTLPGSRIPKIAKQLKARNIHGLIIAGGFQAFESAIEFVDARKKYPEFCIPIIVVPASINNNVPGTEYALGCDTSINVITEVCDKLRLAAIGTKRRVFVVETMGGYCGYLATMAGLASGADTTYIYEEKFTITNLIKDLYFMNSKMTIEGGVLRGLILRSENCNDQYTSDFIYRLYSEEGRGLFTARVNTIGHTQQGGSPTPFDRGLGIKMGTKCVEWFIGQLKSSNKSDGSVHIDTCESAVLIGALQKHFYFTPINALKKFTNFDGGMSTGRVGLWRWVTDLDTFYPRINLFPNLPPPNKNNKQLPIYQWWMRLRTLLRILSKHSDAYEKEALYMPMEESRWELD